MRITLKQLTVFDAVARTRSVRKAADEIALSQSAGSMALRELEAHLRTPLFERRGRKLVLNEHGRRLLPRINALLVQAREIELAGADGRLRGTLRVGAATVIGTYFLPPLLGRFLKQHPEVNIELSVLPSTEVISQVQDMALDCGFIDSPCNRAGIKVEPWGEDRLAIFAAPDHPLARRRRLTVADLKDALWVLQPSGSATRSTVTTGILRQIPNIKIAMTAPNLEAIKRAVAAGNGIGCLSRRAIERELKEGTLREIKVTGIDLSRVTAIIERRDAFDSALRRAFLDFAARAGKARAAKG
jgi:DNA-binding transcriptional LysR family regulator